MNSTETLLKELSERDALLQPGRLDTEVSCVGGNLDTRLTDASLKVVSGALAGDPAKDWLQLARLSKDKNVVALALRRSAEIELIRTLVGQLVSEVDGSQVLKYLESKLYGYYSEKLYYVAISRKIKQLEDLEVSKEVVGAEEIKASLIDELNNLLPTDYREDLTDVEPSINTIQTIHEWLYSQFDDVFEYIDSFDKDELDAEEIKNIFDICINTTPNLKDDGWYCEIIERQKNAISVYALDKKVVIPSQRKASKMVVKKLVVHEIFGHALRSAVADLNGNTVGAIGTATYQTFEESFEITLEQCIEGKYNPMRGVDHYLAIGLALTSNKSKEDIMVLFNKISQLNIIARTKESLDEVGVSRAINTALGQIRRTFAGQTDVENGIPHQKDIDYLHGTSVSWALLNEIVRLDIVDIAMRWLLCAKFNPFNAEERMMVEKITPMPPGLEDFFVAHKY